MQHATRTSARCWTSRGHRRVVIATPDHLHAVVAKAAMLNGKHVTCRSFTYSVHEARALRSLALANPKIVTQMGNQGTPTRELASSTNGSRRESSAPCGTFPSGRIAGGILAAGVPRPTGSPAPPLPRAHSGIRQLSLRESAPRFVDGLISGAAGIALGPVRRTSR